MNEIDEFLKECFKKENQEIFLKWKKEVIFNSLQPERSKREDSLTLQLPDGSKTQELGSKAWVEVEYGCSVPIRFNTSNGVKRMEPGKIYDQNLNVK